jgi:hypothetical protein
MVELNNMKTLFNLYKKTYYLLSQTLGAMIFVAWIFDYIQFGAIVLTFIFYIILYVKLALSSDNIINNDVEVVTANKLNIDKFCDKYYKYNLFARNVLRERVVKRRLEFLEAQEEVNKKQSEKYSSNSYTTRNNKIMKCFNHLEITQDMVKDKSKIKEVIKKQYKKVAKKYHPDLNQDNIHATNNFQIISDSKDYLLAIYS